MLLADTINQGVRIYSGLMSVVAVSGDVWSRHARVLGLTCTDRMVTERVSAVYSEERDAGNPHSGSGNRGSLNKYAAVDGSCTN